MRNSLQKQPVEYDEAIITSMVRFGDADCIVRLFCKNKGRISAFVKNGLKPSKTRGGVMQAPAKATVGLYAKPNSDLFQLTHVDVASHTYSLASNLRGFGLACYLAEISEIFIAEYEQSSDIYCLLDEAYLLLAKNHTGPCLLRAFELKLLALCGYLPELSYSADFPEKAPTVFDPVSGHLLAEGNGNQIPFSVHAQQAAILLAMSPLASLPQIDMDSLRMVGRIFSSRLRQVRSTPLKSIAFLKSVGV